MEEQERKIKTRSKKRAEDAYTEEEKRQRMREA